VAESDRREVEVVAMRARILVYSMVRQVSDTSTCNRDGDGEAVGFFFNRRGYKNM
jgi:hypothetical protein